jgi:hypothetical protein
VFDQRVAKSEASEAGLQAAQAQQEQAQFAVKTAESDVDRIEAILVDLVLVAPRSGRVQYLIARDARLRGALTMHSRVVRPFASAKYRALRGLVLSHRKHGAGERAVGLSQLIENREVIGIDDRYQVAWGISLRSVGMVIPAARDQAACSRLAVA